MRSLLVFVLILTAVSGHVAAQQVKEVPRTEFALELSTYDLEVKAGSSQEVTVSLLRSRSYTKAKATLGLSSSLPQDITLNYEPATGLIDSSVAKITVAENAKPGTYLLLLNCVMNHKSKSTTLKLTVTGASGNEVSKGE